MTPSASILAGHRPLAHLRPPLPASLAPFEDTTRIGVVRYLPDVLGDFGVDVEEAFACAGLRPEILHDPETPVAYPVLQKLLAACERLTQCDYLGLLAVRRMRLQDFGIAGRAALCCNTAGQGLQQFADFFNLYIGATTLSLLGSRGFARLVYVISTRGIDDSRQLQLGAVTVICNVMRDLFGRQWSPAVVTFATRAPSNLQPFHVHFHSPLRFDCEESAVVFERHWLERPLPPVDPALRQQVDVEIRERQAALLENFPAVVRRMVRKRLLIGQFGMGEVSAAFGMHRRTLDRHLEKHGVLYGELVDSVKQDIARQLLRDTDMKVQQVAEALRFSSAANFATAFRRWTGMTPMAYRRSTGT
jgi:AraC-like DNA-binding protein